MQIIVLFSENTPDRARVLSSRPIIGFKNSIILPTMEHTETLFSSLQTGALLPKKVFCASNIDFWLSREIELLLPAFFLEILSQKVVIFCSNFVISIKLRVFANISG
jgi:ABC-type microcin C transport system permease subunit YejE